MVIDRIKLFDHLCNIVLYHYADVCYKDKAISSNEILIAEGTLRENEDDDEGMDHENAYELYERMVIEFANEALPANYELTYDYWGAKCFSTKGHGTRTGYFDGSGCGRIMWFTCWQAMIEYAADIDPRKER